MTPLFAVLLALAAVPAFAAVTVSDDSGALVEIESPARRIVSLAPFLTELAFAAGAGESVIAVDAVSDFPPQVKRLPTIGDSSNLDLERIAGLNPDLVLAWKSGTSAADVANLKRLGYRVFVAEPRRLSDIASLLRRFGALADTRVLAEAASANFELEVAALDHRYRDQPRVRVFYQIWGKPLITANGAHMISDALRLCGGENIFAAESPLTPTVSIEAVLAAHPDAIVVAGSAPSGADESAWRRFPQLRAAKNRHIFYVDPDLLHRQGPRIVQGARALCQQLDEARTDSEVKKER